MYPGVPPLAETEIDPSLPLKHNGGVGFELISTFVGSVIVTDPLNRQPLASVI